MGARSPSALLTELTNAGDTRKRLHAAAVKVQSLFRGSRVRKQAQEEPAPADVEDLQNRATAMRGRCKPKASTSTYSRGFNSTERRTASDAPMQHVGQTVEGFPAARLQSRHARRSASRCQGFLGSEGRDRRSLSPKAKSPPYHARQMFDAGIGSRLQVSGKCAPRR